jgi:hypothetical protein
VDDGNADGCGTQHGADCLDRVRHRIVAEHGVPIAEPEPGQFSVVQRVVGAKRKHGRSADGNRDDVYNWLARRDRLAERW